MLSRIFARGCSLSLGRLVSWNLFACGGRSGNVWESASQKNRVARWKVSVRGSGPPGLPLIVEEGRWVDTQLSLSCLYSVCSCLSIRDGAGSPHTWREEERVVVDQILLERIASRRRPQVEAANALVIQLTPCCHAGKSRGFGRFYLLLDLNQWFSPYESDTLTAESSRSSWVKSEKIDPYKRKPRNQSSNAHIRRIKRIAER